MVCTPVHSSVTRSRVTESTSPMTLELCDTDTSCAMVLPQSITLNIFKNHIFEKVSPAMEAVGLEARCLGGGKIEHNNTEKKLRVFGESTGYGKADHAVTVEKLKAVYKDYEITME
ncbi:si:dkey-51e6.1 isoform X2 [Hoplias malabaricus]|uniref:si:dkey-51e6.1 isoform X2 n=1 Tax=Hoplias malabaricus TaxID=27720 RepID=UPI003461A9F6